MSSQRIGKMLRRIFTSSVDVWVPSEETLEETLDDVKLNDESMTTCMMEHCILGGTTLGADTVTEAQDMFPGKTNFKKVRLHAKIEVDIVPLVTQTFNPDTYVVHLSYKFSTGQVTKVCTEVDKDGDHTVDLRHAHQVTCPTCKSSSLYELLTKK